MCVVKGRTKRKNKDILGQQRKFKSNEKKNKQSNHISTEIRLNETFFIQSYDTGGRSAIRLGDSFIF